MFTTSGHVLKHSGPLDGPSDGPLDRSLNRPLEGPLDGTFDGPLNSPEPPNEPAAKFQKISEDMGALRNGLLFYFFKIGFFII